MNPNVQPHIIDQYDQLHAYSSRILAQESRPSNPADRHETDKAFYEKGVLLAFAGEQISDELLHFAITQNHERNKLNHDHTALTEELAVIHLAQITREAGKLITQYGLR